MASAVFSKGTRGLHAQTSSKIIHILFFSSRLSFNCLNLQPQCSSNNKSVPPLRPHTAAHTPVLPSLTWAERLPRPRAGSALPRAPSQGTFPGFSLSPPQLTKLCSVCSHAAARRVPRCCCPTSSLEKPGCFGFFRIR